MRPFALHDCDKLFLFMAPDEQTKTLWTSALKRLEIAQFRDLELWVTFTPKALNFVKFVHELSPSKPCNRTKVTLPQQLSGYMCKVSQM